LISFTGILLVYLLPIEYICKYEILFIILGSIGGFIFGLSVFFYFTFERYEQKKFDWKYGIEGLSGGLILIWLNRNKNFIISLPYWLMFIFPLIVGGLFHLLGWTFNKLKNKKDREFMIGR
jgi:energy-converting hydrogenase Eha subunit G